MPRKQWSDGQEIIQQDLNAISSVLEMELYDRVLYELTRRQTSAFFQGGFKGSFVNSTTSQLAAGNGFYYDNTQVDPEPFTRWLYQAASSNVSHSTPDASHNRIDVLYVTPNRGTSQTASRSYKDPTTGNISTQTFNVETDWSPTIAVAAGTPATSPVAPSIPAGSIAIAQVLVTAVTGIAGASAYTDVRPRFQFGSGWHKIQTITASQTMDNDDEVIIVNASGGNVVYTALPVASCAGKKVTFKRSMSDSSGNTATFQCSGAETCDSQNALTVTKGTSITVVSDGTQWNLI